jgi:hypothetical protein
MGHRSGTPRHGGTEASRARWSPDCAAIAVKRRYLAEAAKGCDVLRKHCTVHGASRGALLTGIQEEIDSWGGGRAEKARIRYLRHPAAFILVAKVHALAMIRRYFVFGDSSAESLVSKILWTVETGEMEENGVERNLEKKYEVDH